ncbi:HAD hydrolase-like protein [Lichenicoccus sp.]|uniref:HAD hydrolase-like protein n=1 Tax=Lichenicoccus sp. TaxID=2781899 RepID=UPI003D14925A
MTPRPRHPSRQAVLLDLDGTLIASRDGIIACLRRALGELGHTLDAGADLDWVVGPPLPDIMARLLSEFGDDRVEAAVLAYRRNYEASGMLDSPLFDGVAGFMQALAASGRRILLATSKPEHLARRILSMRGLIGHFHGCYGARPDDSGAEKPELIGRLIEAEAIDAAHSVMVGDRRFDISGAHANSMRAVGALWGYGGRAELEAAGADGLADSPHTLLAEIERQLTRAAPHQGQARDPPEQLP